MMASHSHNDHNPNDWLRPSKVRKHATRRYKISRFQMSILKWQDFKRATAIVMKKIQQKSSWRWRHLNRYITLPKLAFILLISKSNCLLLIAYKISFSSYELISVSNIRDSEIAYILYIFCSCLFVCLKNTQRSCIWNPPPSPPFTKYRLNRRFKA